MRLPHCTGTFSGHNPLCDRNGQYCSMESAHSGDCKPHGTAVWSCWNCGSTDGTRSHIIAGEIVTECRDCGAAQ